MVGVRIFAGSLRLKDRSMLRIIAIESIGLWDSTLKIYTVSSLTEQQLKNLIVCVSQYPIKSTLTFIR